MSVSFFLSPFLCISFFFLFFSLSVSLSIPFVLIASAADYAEVELDDLCRVQQRLAYTRLSETAHILVKLVALHNDAWLADLHRVDRQMLLSCLGHEAVNFGNDSFLSADHAGLDSPVAMPSLQEVRWVSLFLRAHIGERMRHAHTWDFSIPYSDADL